MMLLYVRCMRYVIKKVFDLDYSDFDVMSSKVERVQKKYTPFALSIFPKENFYHEHSYAVSGTFIYFRFWNKNHYDYYMIDISSLLDITSGFDFGDSKFLEY